VLLGVYTGLWKGSNAGKSSKFLDSSRGGGSKTSIMSSCPEEDFWDCTDSAYLESSVIFLMYAKLRILTVVEG
jgi:hypothetical protein